MASVTLSSVADVFPSGTSVGAYLSKYRRDGGPPSGAAADTSTVATAGSLVFDGLADDQSYVAYASVSGAHKYKAFTTDRPRTRPVVIVGELNDGYAPVWSDDDDALVATPVEGRVPAGISAITYGDSRFPDQPTSVTEGGVTTTYTYNADGSYATRTCGGVTETFSYSNGKITGSVLS
jgi:hypothetical protein